MMFRNRIPDSDESRVTALLKAASTFEPSREAPVDLVVRALDQMDDRRRPIRRAVFAGLSLASASVAAALLFTMVRTDSPPPPKPLLQARPVSSDWKPGSMRDGLSVFIPNVTSDESPKETTPAAAGSTHHRLQTVSSHNPSKPPVTIPKAKLVEQTVSEQRHDLETTAFMVETDEDGEPISAVPVRIRVPVRLAGTGDEQPDPDLKPEPREEL